MISKLFPLASRIIQLKSIKLKVYCPIFSQHNLIHYQGVSTMHPKFSYPVPRRDETVIEEFHGIKVKKKIFNFFAASFISQNCI